MLHITPDTLLAMFSSKGICSLLHVQCGEVNKTLVIEVIKGQGRTMLGLFQNLSLMSHSNFAFRRYCVTTNLSLTVSITFSSKHQNRFSWSLFVVPFLKSSLMTILLLLLGCQGLSGFIYVLLRSQFPPPECSAHERY